MGRGYSSEFRRNSKVSSPNQPRSIELVGQFGKMRLIIF